MSSKRSKKKQELPASSVELNVMPFVDIFSLLCTFLLFSAVFVTIGILQVQVPFLSNAAPTDDDKGEDKRSVVVKIEVDKKQVELSTSYSKAPINPEKKQFQRTTAGLLEFHKELLRIRNENKETDKVTLFVDDDIIYDDLIKVLDQIKIRFPGDLGYFAGSSPNGEDGGSLYPKVVMGNILL